MFFSASQQTIKENWEDRRLSVETPNRLKGFYASWNAFKELCINNQTFVSCSHCCKFWKKAEVTRNTKCPQGEFVKNSSGLILS